MTTTAKIIALVVLVVLLGGGSYFVFMKNDEAPAGSPEAGTVPENGDAQTGVSGATGGAPIRKTTVTPPSGEKIVGEEDVSGIPKTVVKPGVQNIEISNFAFFSNSIKVNLGTTVIWTNKDSVRHDVTSDTGLFKSPLLSQGQVYSFLFSKPGTYSYHCGPHPQMTAKIIVE
ncbi:MAG: plastocyanin/azurin family copper-binding protein [Patescibacteria group bacterium]